MRVITLGDLHGQHRKIKVPECDLLCCVGDYGAGRTSVVEMLDFLGWLDLQPARKKVFIAGNHDHCLSGKLAPAYDTDAVIRLVHKRQHEALMNRIQQYPDIVYLKDESFIWEGLRIHGMPWSPVFHSDYWVFNATEEQMVKHLAKVPSNVHILLAHGPAYGYMDLIPQEYAQPREDLHKGCKKTLEVIHRRLKKLKLFAFGHIHNAEMPNRSGSDNYGVRMVKVTNTKSVLFSNAACVDNSYNIVNPMPLIIDL